MRETFATIAPRYDLANHLLSGGVDFLWRAQVAEIVKSWVPRRILDLATGSGDLLLAIQKENPGIEVTGADFCLPMLEQAAKKGLRRLVQGDGMRLPFQTGAFDGVTVAFGLRNMKSWEEALREMARVIRKDGHLLILDFSLPTAGWIRGIYRFYLHRVLPLLAGWISGNRAAYDYLGESIERFPSGKAMTQMIEENGYGEARARPLLFGIVSIYTARRRG